MNLSKKSLAFIAGIAFSVLTAMVVMFGLTSSVAFGAEGTADAPEFYCEYFDEQGNAVDGNSLTAGTYNVDFYVKGFNTISVLEFTATYDTSIVTVGQVSNLISSMSSMGTVTTDGNLVFGFASKTGPVSVNAQGERLATFSLTFSADCDAADYITVSDNPNLTFVVVDSTGDNYDDEYALTESFEGYTGSLTLMSCDITPAFDAGTISVSGKIVIANSVTADGGTYGLGGIDIAVDGVVVGTSADDGTFTVSVPKGTTSFTVQRSKAIFARTVTLKGDADITDAVIPVIMGDYNDDQLINGTDKVDFSKSLTNYNVYCDYNCDGLVNGTDKTSFAKFIDVSSDYAGLTIG